MKVLQFTYKLFPRWIQWLAAIPDSRVRGRCRYKIEQIGFCGLMLFVLRNRSLRAFTIETRNSDSALCNFKKWITIENIPSDDELRYCLSTVSTKTLNLILKNFHQRIERQKLLSNHKFLNKYELIVLDGTGQITSSKISCEKCLTRALATGQTQYMHGQLLASLTNQSGDYALPLQYEPIERSDTETQYSKNDCELNAAKRLIQKLKAEFPKRSFCFLGDNLFAVESLLKPIHERCWHFIVTAKPERNKEVFLMFDYLHERKRSLEIIDKKSHRHIYSWSNGLPLKQSKYKEEVLHVNLLNYEEIDTEGIVVYKSAWITDVEITTDNVKSIARAGRARFVIENRNFNEQKNLGFQAEHNFGHFGNLPNVFFGLAQIAQLITELFRFWKPGKESIKNSGSKRRYFERLAVLVTEVILEISDPILYLKFDFNSS